MSLYQALSQQFTQVLSQDVSPEQKPAVLLLAEFGQGAITQVKDCLKEMEKMESEQIAFMEVDIDDLPAQNFFISNNPEASSPLAKLAQNPLSLLVVNMRDQFNKDFAIDLALEKDFDGVDLKDTVIVLLERHEDAFSIPQDLLDQFEVVSLDAPQIRPMSKSVLVSVNKDEEKASVKTPSVK